MLSAFRTVMSSCHEHECHVTRFPLGQPKQPRTAEGPMRTQRFCLQVVGFMGLASSASHLGTPDGELLLQVPDTCRVIWRPVFIGRSKVSQAMRRDCGDEDHVTGT